MPNKIGTGIIKHPVEFSKNNHTPDTNPHRPAPGHSFHFTESYRPCQPVSPGYCLSDPVRPTTGARSAAARSKLTGPAGRPPRSCRKLARFPADRQHYPLVTRPPNGPPNRIAGVVHRPATAERPRRRRPGPGCAGAAGRCRPGHERPVRPGAGTCCHARDTPRRRPGRYR